MKKSTGYILVFGDDFINYTDLINGICQFSTNSNIQKASDALHFIEALKRIESSASSLQQMEVRIIIDLDLPFFEAYVCLQALASYDFQCPLSVFLLESNYSTEACPDIAQYCLAGRFKKPLRQQDIDLILSARDLSYFQKDLKENVHNNSGKFL